MPALPALRVMTFNVRGSSYKEDKRNQWKHRAQLNVETIRGSNPDLIGFQELQPGNMRTYRTELPSYGYIAGPRYNNEPPFNYPAIFWKLSRLEWLASGGFFLGEDPSRARPDWDATLIRSANWVSLRDRVSGASFLHLNTHLDHLSERARIEGSRLIVRQLQVLSADTLPVIVTGDFNAHPGSEVYTVFRRAGYDDTYPAVGHTDGDVVNSAHAFEGRRHPARDRGGSGRIDWILTKGAKSAIETTACSIITDERPPLYPSDHYPVVADLVLATQDG